MARFGGLEHPLVALSAGHGVGWWGTVVPGATSSLSCGLSREQSHVPVSAAPRPCFTSLPQKPAGGQACPFTKAQAHHSYCLKKNFLALSLKLNCPLRVSYFVCSCLSCGGTTLPPLLLDRSAGESRLQAKGPFCWPPCPRPLQGAGHTRPPQADVPRALLKARPGLPQASP